MSGGRKRPEQPHRPRPARDDSTSKPDASAAGTSNPRASNRRLQKPRARSSASPTGAGESTAAESGAPKPAASRSRRPKPAPDAGAVRSGWLGGIRFSGFSIIMMGVLVLAVVVLAPTISAFAQQRQQIAALRAEVSQQEAELTALKAERERWNDETFIVTQARERLYYVLPGEVSYLVIDDRGEAERAASETPVSAEVTEAKGDWLRTLLDSAMTAGLAPAAVDPASAPPATPPATDPAAAATGGTR
ncbi:septum formation initiator family protein [Agromyces soli]